LTGAITGSNLSNPLNYLPGIQVYNNKIANGAGNGITITEEQTHPSTPAGYHQILNNTIHNNSGDGINIVTRGGPNVLNNIVTKNNFSVNINDIGTGAVTVVNYNLFFQNATNTPSGQFNGVNNISGIDPLYVDVTNGDLRIFGNSVATDAALSNLSDRIFTARWPDAPTRVPNDDFRDRPRNDNPSKPNVGSGQFPFFDIGAFETNESPLRVISLKPFFTATGIVPGPVGSFEVVFAGRVDPSTINVNPLTPSLNTVIVLLGAVRQTITTVSNSYDPVRDQDTWTFTFGAALADGTYSLLIDGTSLNANDPAVRDIAGQLLDGEFPPPATAPVLSFPSGNNVPGGDFGYSWTVVTSSIGDLVWNDLNGDGIKQANENGIANVLVNLTGAGADSVFGTADDLVFPSQLTNNTGNYTFSQLRPGLYRVSYQTSTLPPNFVLTNPPDPKNVTLGIDEDRTDVDFGFWQDLRNGAIGDLVWNDLNNDGVRQPSEPGIAGVRIDLVGSGPDRALGTADDVVFSPQFTVASGAYSFTNLPAWSYRITVDPTSPPLTGFGLTTGNSPSVLSLVPGQVVTTMDFGYIQANSAIGGLVWEDLNQDGGQQLPAEAGFAGIRVFIDQNGNTLYDVGEKNTTTDGQGNWTITALAAGTYTVRVDRQSLPGTVPWLPTTTHPRVITVAPGQIATGVLFGFVQDPSNAQISGRVYNDFVGDGAFNGADTGIGGINVQLTWAGIDDLFGTPDDVVYPSLTTNASGQYASTATLPSGNWRALVQNPPSPNYFITTAAGNPITTALTPSQNLTTADFGYQQKAATISGVVWNDLDGDGVFEDPPETGRFSGVTVFDDLNNNGTFEAGTERSAVSGAGGAFTITQLGVGTHRLRILSGLPVPFGPTVQPVIVVVNTPTDAIVGANIGANQKSGIIQGLIYVDTNGNGVRNPGEDTGVVGATVTLDRDQNGFDPGDPFVVTSNSGLYSFTGLGYGTYQVRVTPPSGGTVSSTNPASVFTDGNTTPSVQDFGIIGLNGGVFYLSFATGGSVLNSDGSTFNYQNTDVIRLKQNTDGSYVYRNYFFGTQFGLSSPSERIDAFYIVPSVNTPPGYSPGEILISTSGAFTVQTTYTAGVASGPFISGFGEDVLRFTPSSYTPIGRPRSGTWSLLFDGSTKGLSGVSGNVDAVSLRQNGVLLISPAGTVTLASAAGGSFTVNGEDIVRYITSNLFSPFFDGSTVGLSGANENVDAANVVWTGGSTYQVYLSTSGAFSVPPNITGTSGDVVRFNATTLGNSTAGSFGPGLFFQAANFGLGGKNTSGFQFGVAPFDQPQLTPGAPFQAEGTDISVRWSTDTGVVNVFVDPTMLTPGQVSAMRRAISTASHTFEQVTGKRLVEVSAASQADVVMRGDHTTTIGGKAEGVLAHTTMHFDIGVHGLLPNGQPYTEFLGHDVAGAGDITFVVDWNWFSGRNATQVGRNRFDLESTALHELGHVLGLPDNLTNPRASMYQRLARGQVKRTFAPADVNALRGLYGVSATPGTTSLVDAAFANPAFGRLADLVAQAPTQENATQRKDVEVSVPADLRALNLLFTQASDTEVHPIGTRAAAQVADLLTHIELTPE
jgi:parallel beta-helix repeat protein